MRELDRRRFISWVGVGAAILAGCSGTSDGGNPTSTSVDDTQTAESTQTEEPTPNPEAEEHLDAAVNALQTASEDFVAEIEKINESETYVSFQAKQISDEIDTAESELAAAEEMAVGDQLQVVQGLRSVVEWIRPLTEALDNFDSALNVMQTGNSLIDDRRWGDAAEKYESGEELLVEAGALLTQAEDAGEEIDVSGVEEIDESRLDPVREAMESLRVAITAWTYLARGFGGWLTGTDRLLDGIDEYQRGRYEEAGDLAESAHAEFSDASTAIQEGKPVSPYWLMGAFDKVSCSTDAFIDASTHLKAAAEAQEQGDPGTAGDEMGALQEALNRC